MSSLHVDDQLFQQTAAIAAQQGKTVDEFVRETLRQPSHGDFVTEQLALAIDQNGQLVIGDPYTINPDSRDLYDGGIIRINPVGGGQTLIARGQENYVNPRGIAVFRAIGSVKRSQ